MPVSHHAPRVVANTYNIVRVSTNASGEQVDGDNDDAMFSPDGSKVVFCSRNSTNLIENITGGTNIFTKDLMTGAIEIVSKTPDGISSAGSFLPAFSPDGTKVAFASIDYFFLEVYGDELNLFLKDLVTGSLAMQTKSPGGVPGDSATYTAAFSPDGTRLAFSSRASNLVVGDTNSTADVFVKDLSSGVITRVSTSSSGIQGNGYSGYTWAPVFSPDGQKLAFESRASNLVTGDTNVFSDIFIKDLMTGAITRVSTNSSGAQTVNGDSTFPVFSPDGKKIAFQSEATNLVSGDSNGKSDIFIKDLVTGVVSRVSTDAAGGEGNGPSVTPVFSPDGTRLAFASRASNLVANDTGSTLDIFIKDLVTGAILRVAAGDGGNNDYGMAPKFSSDGMRLVFSSGSSTVVSGDTNGTSDIFVATLNVAGSSGVTTEDGALTAGGSFGFTDEDLADTHTVSVAAVAPGTFGVLTASLSRDTTGTGSGGEVTWSYAVDNALIQYLKAGETKVETFTVRVSDGADTAEQAVSVTIRGANDAPALTGAAAVLADGAQDAAYAVTATQLLQGWTDVEGDALTVSEVIVDHGMVSYDPGTARYMLVPEADYAGPVVISYKVTDSHEAVAATLSLTVVEDVIIRSVTTTLLPGQHALVLSGGDIDGYGNNLNNVIIGSSGENLLSGGDGDDRLFGTKGHDTLYGGAGDDRLDGGRHHDVMYGGTGDDTYSVGNSGDVVVELAGEGTDTVKTDLRSYRLGDNVENLILRGTKTSSGTGNDLDNVIYGNGLNNVLSGGLGNDSLFGGKGNDSLNGDAGDDQLDGGAGRDTLAGGAGNDVYLMDSSQDWITERGGEGIDTVRASADIYFLAANVEILIMTGTADLGYGNDMDNVIYGNGADNRLVSGGGNDQVHGGKGNDQLEGGLGSDTLYGGEGNDWLVGGGDADVMYGGFGDDTYSVANSADVVVEHGDEGTEDTVKTDLYAYVLGANIENLILTGTHHSDGAGNGLDNVMYGNGVDNGLDGGAGNDRLFGGRGNDTLNGGTGDDRLDGGSGADSMAGGQGNDTYSVDDAGDRVTEGGGAGVDTVKTVLDGYVLGGNIENLILVGASNIGGTGNGLGNIIIGNGADNRLQGGGGADVLTGGAGQDIFVFAGLGDSAISARDYITDLSAEDSIDLHLIDADVHTDGDQGFHQVGAFTHHAAEMVLSYDGGTHRTTMSLDANGDGVADFALLIAGSHLDAAGWNL